MYPIAEGFNALQFIEEVEKRPVLWDSNRPDYADRLEKRRAWEELCCVLMLDFKKRTLLKKHKTVLDVQRRWKSMRDCYRKALMKSHAPSTTRQRPYIYSTHMSFLQPFVDVTPPSVDTLIGSHSEEHKIKQEDTEQPSPSLPSPQHIKMKFKISKKQRIFQKTLDPEKREMLQRKRREILQQTIVSSPKKRKVDMLHEKTGEETDTSPKSRDTECGDPDKCFLLSLLPHLKGVPEVDKLDVQGKIFGILLKYKQRASSRQTPLAQNVRPPQHHSGGHRFRARGKTASTPPLSLTHPSPGPSATTLARRSSTLSNTSHSSAGERMPIATQSHQKPIFFSNILGTVGRVEPSTGSPIILSPGGVPAVPPPEVPVKSEPSEFPEAVEETSPVAEETTGPILPVKFNIRIPIKPVNGALHESI